MHAARRFSSLGLALLLIGGMQPAPAAGNDRIFQDIGFEELAAPDNARPAEALPPPPDMPPSEAPPADWSAAKPPSEASSEPTSEAPSESTSEAPSESTREAPSESTREAPSESTREAPSESTREAPSESTRVAPDEPTREATREDAHQAAGEVVEAYEFAPENAMGHRMPPRRRSWSDRAVPSDHARPARESSAWWDLRSYASALSPDRFRMAGFGFGSAATPPPGLGCWADPCCSAPKIKYWNHPLLAPERCDCHAAKKQMIVLPIPSDCCSVEVPVCLPCTCEAPPSCDSHRDLLGRMTYDFCWPCGQRVKIVDRHTGTLVVHTFQRD